MADPSEYKQMQDRTSTEDDGACMVLLKQLRRTTPRMSEKNRRLLAVDLAFALVRNGWVFGSHVRVEEVIALPEETS